jgi:hypothetical protein
MCVECTEFAFNVLKERKDLDIVIMTGLEQEELKRRLCQHNSLFFTEAAKTPGATYRVLKYAMRWSRAGNAMRPVKVDVLVAKAPSLHIPNIPRDRIQTVNNYPVCPFEMLTLLRMQGWEDHLNATQHFHRNKAYVDARDLQDFILPFAKGSTFGAGANVSQTLFATAEGYLPQDFVQRSKERVLKYGLTYKSQIGDWRALGVDVPEPEPEPVRTKTLSWRARAYDDDDDFDDLYDFEYNRPDYDSDRDNWHYHDQIDRGYYYRSD